jgi:hypothetical protein
MTIAVESHGIMLHAISRSGKIADVDTCSAVNARGTALHKQRRASFVRTFFCRFTVAVADERSAFAVAHRYHAGIIVRAADVPRDAWPVRVDPTDAEHLELDWGEREYYVRDDPEVWLR